VAVNLGLRSELIDSIRRAWDVNEAGVLMDAAALK